MPGGGRSKTWWRIYEELRRQGKSKESAARIASSAEAKSKSKGGKS